VSLGADVAHYGWIYLANNDMEIDRLALVNALSARGTGVFAVASRILPADAAMVNQETNLTAFHFPNGTIEIFDVVPQGTGEQSTFYAGGGSSLFRADVLREFLAISGAYDPFYWEDVEWAARARKKYGLRVVFADASRAVHQRRATISRFYQSTEVDRIFRRNAFLYQLRNVTRDGSLVALFEEIARSDWLTVREILARTAGLLGARAATHFYAADDRTLRDSRGR
jgi:GT2 family glycosyltransferase